MTNIISEELQESAVNTDKQDYYRREEVEGTPFAIISEGDSEINSYLVMGQYRLTEKAPEKALRAIIKNKPWDLLTTVVAVIVEKVLEIKKDEK